MPITKRIVRGLQDIRTISGRVDQSFHPYKAYLRIGCLEMEKARRGSERASATHRVKLIDARFQEIEVEKAELIRNLGEQKTDTFSPVDMGGNEPQRSERPARDAFKIRY